MRKINVSTSNRSLTKEMYKYIDGTLRKTANQIFPEIEKAFTDELLYGQSCIHISDDGIVKHIPLSKIYKETGDERDKTESA